MLARKTHHTPHTLSCVHMTSPANDSMLLHLLIHASHSVDVSPEGLDKEGRVSEV